MPGLDEDLTKIETDHFLKEDFANKVVPAGRILQISQCTNISMPKKNREGEVPGDPKKSIFKVVLTDGKTSVSGLVTNHATRITSSTPPGTKVQITQDTPILMNLIELKPQNTKVLGGFVPGLVSHWEMQTEAEKMKKWGFRTSSQVKDGPPLWKPFNFRSQPVASDIRNVKAMDIVKEQQKEASKTIDDPNKAKFDTQRQEIIAQAAKKAQVKQFGEGKRLLDKGVIDIMNEGFTEEEATEALRRYKIPQKAIKMLKGENKPRDPAAIREARRRRRRGDDEDDDGPTGNARGEQPSSSISLFGFIAATIKTDDVPAKTQPSRDSFETEVNDRSYDTRYERQSSQDQDRRSRGGRGRQDFRSRNEDSRQSSERPSHYESRGYEPRGGRGGRGGRGSRGRGGYRDRGGYQNYSSEPAPQFAGLKETHFPSLGEETPSQPAKPQQQYTHDTSSSRRPAQQQESYYERDRPQTAPRGGYHQQYQQPRSDYQNQRQNHSDQRSFRDDIQRQSYPETRGPREPSFEQQLREAEILSLRGDYRRDAQRGAPPRFNSYDQQRLARPNRDRGLPQQFSNLNLRPNTQENYQEEWRPSQTLVFTRSKK